MSFDLIMGVSVLIWYLLGLVCSFRLIKNPVMMVIFLLPLAVCGPIPLMLDWYDRKQREKLETERARAAL